MAYQFRYSCMEIRTGSRQFNALRAMIDDNRTISRETFMRQCPSAREVFLGLGYAAHPSQGLTAAGDYHISYHRSRWNGKRCYYFRWSAIEHIFLQEPK